ncbi:MAG: DUF120 domain-containing protein [Candidatus Methanospirareceae archaeon]
MGGEDMLSLRKLALLGAIEQPIKLSSSSFSSFIHSSVQTAARRLQKLEKEGLIKRTMTKDGQWIMLTKKGIDKLREEYYEYQRIFSSPYEPIEICGYLITGLGEGKYYIGLEGYRRQFEAKLGFSPFPGTLNLSLRGKDIEMRRRLNGRKGIDIDGFEAEGRTFGGVKCFHCEILHENAKGIKSALIIPERTHYPDDVLEIIASVNLRERLRLKDGDEVRIKVV